MSDEEWRRRARRGEEGDILAAARSLREAERRPVNTHDAYSFDTYLPGECECCTGGPVRFESARTQYCWDGAGADPNAPRLLCAPCAKDHHE